MPQWPGSRDERESGGGFLWALLALLPLEAWGVIETYSFSSPELEARVITLEPGVALSQVSESEHRRFQCPIARDLRVVLYEQLEAGASDDEILDFMVARYGEFVRYRPGVDRNTALLWVSPALLSCWARLACCGISKVGESVRRHLSPRRSEKSLGG